MGYSGSPLAPNPRTICVNIWIAGCHERNHHRRPALCGPQKSVPAGRPGQVSPHQMGDPWRHLGDLLPAALRPLASRTRPAQPSRAHRFPASTVLFLLHRAVAAGGLLFHWPADHRRDDLVSDERRGRPGVVRVHVSADDLDGSFLCSRAPCRRRPPRTDHERQARMDVHAHPPDCYQTRYLADDRVVDRRSLGVCTLRMPRRWSRIWRRFRRRSSPICGSPF